MKHKTSKPLLVATCLALPGLVSAQVSLDGVRDPAENYVEYAVQSEVSAFGGGGFLANFHAVQEAGVLNLHLAGAAADNAILIFIDSKAGGVNTITNDLMTSGGEEFAINNLGSSTTAGLTFEPGFEADYAVRVYGNGDLTETFVNLYDLQTGVRSFVGQATSGVPSSGIITGISAFYSDFVGTAPADYATSDSGIEVALSLSAMGVPTGSADVLCSAILVNNTSSFASNQVLGAATGQTGNLGTGITTTDYDTLAGTQTITIPVTNDDNDGDGDPNATDPDDDNDGLLDIHETGGGVYTSPTDTGTDPLDADSDDDGYNDGDEVNNTSALGYQSDPNIPNYTVMTVPGNYTTPSEFNPTPGGSTPSIDMAQLGTGNLTDQYIWQLDYPFPEARFIAFKFAAGTYAVNWGTGTGGFLTRNGPDVNTNIVASGIHRFTFNQANLTYTLERRTFASDTDFLTAYGVLAGNDDDGDTILNEDEFAANTDPTNADTDGDGIDDDVDPNPLVPGTRDITFSLNTRVLQKLGLFDPNTDTVRVVGAFWNNFSVGDGPALTDADDDGIYEVVITYAGRADEFGPYKFYSDSPTLPVDWNGFERGTDRNFTVNPAGSDQVLPTAYFNTDNINGNGTYFQWADQVGLDLDSTDSNPSANADGDGLSNRQEYFFGSDPTAVDTTPFTAEYDGFDLVVTWLERNDAGITYTLEEAGDISSWAPSAATPFDTFDQSGVPAGYTRREAFVPADQTENFIQVSADATVPDP